MLSTLTRTVMVAAVEKGTGVPPAGPVSTALLTTGASLLMLRGRRSVGLALLVVGGALRWHETVRPASEAARKRPLRPASSAATGSR